MSETGFWRSDFVTARKNRKKPGFFGRTGGQKPGFGDRTSLQWAKTAKNPVSVVLMPQSCQSLEILIICGWSHRTGLVDKQIFGAVVLVDTIDVRFTFQGTGEAKCIHAIFAIAHLVLADEFSLL